LSLTRTIHHQPIRIVLEKIGDAVVPFRQPQLAEPE
jgi:hypothetical protein